MLVCVFSLILVHRCARGGIFSAGYLILENLSMLQIISKHKGNPRRNQVRHWRLKIQWQDTKSLRWPGKFNFSSSLHLLQWRAKIKIVVPDISVFVCCELVALDGSTRLNEWQCSLGWIRIFLVEDFLFHQGPTRPVFQRYIKLVANHLRTVIVNAGEDIYERIVTISREIRSSVVFVEISQLSYNSAERF